MKCGLPILQCMEPQLIIFKKVNKVILFLVCLIIGGSISVLLGVDVNFDMHNYHIYNGYAFFSGRVFNDLPTAIYQNYLNPLLDVLNYLLVYNLNSYPAVYAFIQGIWYGFLIFLVYNIAELYIWKNIQYRYVVILTAVAIGVTGFAVYTQIGTMFNEVQVGVIFLLGFYFFSKYVFYSDSYRPFMILLGGFFMGASMGVKLTAGVSCLGIGIAFLLVSWKIKKPVLTLLLLAFGGILGFIVVNGWWMYLLYSNFGNPVFPYYNSIFKSPLYSLSDVHDIRFFPRNIFDAIFFPFQWVQFSTKYGSEIPFKDPRWSVIYILILATLFSFLLSKTRKFAHLFKNSLGTPDIFLILFSLLTFLVWEKTFAILRYTVAIEALTGVLYIILFLYIFQWISKRKLYIICFALISLLFFLFTSKYENWGRQSISANIINTEKITIPDDNIIVMTGATNLYVVPYLNTKARVVNYHDFGIVYSDKSRKIIDDFRGDKVFIGSREFATPFFETYTRGMYCRVISEYISNAVTLCVPKEKAGEYFNFEPIIHGNRMNNNDGKLLFRGWNRSENSHRWSFEKSAEIVVYVDDVEKYEGNIILEFDTYGAQSMDIYLNDILIEKFPMQVYNGKLDVKFNNSALIKGVNILRFEIPNATNSEGITFPLLGIALRTIEFK